jgi:CBS domain-containing protein
MSKKEVDRSSEAERLRRFTKRLLDDVRALEAMLDTNLIESGVRRIGAEQEMFLVDQSWRPAPISPEVLRRIDDPRVTTELGAFNLEININPLLFEGKCLRELEDDVRSSVETVREAAKRCGSEIVLVGILPTLWKSDLELENMTPEPRYYALNEALNRLRGGSYKLYIRGMDELLIKHDSVMLEACNTSFQVHFQVSPAEFARFYNIAMVVAAPLMAVAANSPLLFGRRLWSETRIALFQQSVDTRSAMSDLRESHPRVYFGSSWVDDSILDVYRQDIARFKVLLGGESDEDALAMVAAGQAPRLQALNMFNGTVYRWNRPCYGVKDGLAHLRIENRILPSGPTPIDEVANAAFWFGMVSGCVERYEDIRQVMQFDHARENFQAAAQLGLRAPVSWLEGRETTARELILDELLDLSREGLAAAGIDSSDIDRYMGVIEGRVTSRQNGSAWMLRSLESLSRKGSLEERLRALTAAMSHRQRENRPVHEWSRAELREGGGWKPSHIRVEQYMTTELVTVHDDQPLDLVANLMDWHHIRHIPVEDEQRRLVGLVTRRTLLRYLASEEARNAEHPMPVSTVMQRDLVTIEPGTPTLDAIEIMRNRQISALPVVRDGTLVGIVTERDFMEIARQLLVKGLKE